MLPKPWPPDHASRKVEALCAIQKANVTIAVLLQACDTKQTKKKTG